MRVRGTGIARARRSTGIMTLSDTIQNRHGEGRQLQDQNIITRQSSIFSKFGKFNTAYGTISAEQKQQTHIKLLCSLSTLCYSAEKGVFRVAGVCMQMIFLFMTLNLAVAHHHYHC